MNPEEFFNQVRAALAPAFHCVAEAGYLEHLENHHDGSQSRFRMKASGMHVAFSLDKRGREPFAILAPGLNLKNDLTVVCLDTAGNPLIFVIECKNSSDPGNAQQQIEYGMAFCEYLFRLIRFRHGLKLCPRCLGVAVYRPKSPPKGLTRPQFVRQGKQGLLRAEWHMDVELPLSELIRSAEGKG